MMPGGKSSGRVFEPEMAALARQSTGDGLLIDILAPAVGLLRGAPAPGTLVRPGDTVGELEILGVLHRLIAPPQARGIVVQPSHSDLIEPARQPVAFGQAVLRLDPNAAGHAIADISANDHKRGDEAQADQGGPVFRAPTSGRYYSRSGPDKPPFLTVGDEITAGTTVCLLEVMKTFNRVVYGGSGLPERARVKEVVPRDEDDLAAGDVILRLE